MKSIIAIGAITLLLTGCGTSASLNMDTAMAIYQPLAQATEAPLKLIVDGEAVLLSLPPFFLGDKVYVPANVLSEYYSATLDWNPSLQALTITDGSSSYILKPNNEYMQDGEFKHTLGGPAILRNGTLYIPADSLNSLSGATVELNASQTAVTVTSGSVSTTVRQPNEPLAIAEENDNVKLYTALKDKDIYKGFIAEVNGTKHSFNWEAPRLLNMPPEIHYVDLDQDGQEEMVIILPLGTGTGIVQQALHVIKTKDWNEVPTPSAEKAATALVSSTVSKDKADLLVKLQIKGPTPAMVTLRLPDRAEDGDFGNQAGIGAVTSYIVENGKLNAETNVYIGALESIGTLNLVYTAGTEGMELESISFEPHEEYAAYVEGMQL